jgi:SAM-dependent methyltransferase
VPISYHGRQYTEGKKIGWKDAVSAVWTILKYRVIADVGREDAGFTTLRRVEVLKRYNRFLWDLVAPFVGGRVLEIGSGTGLMTKFLAGKTRVTATDIDQDYVQLLSRTFSGNPNVEVRHLDLAALDQDGIPKKAVRHGRLLERARAHRGRRACAHVDARGAAAGRAVVLIIPAVKGIYGEIDRAIHHYRRYSRNEIEEKLPPRDSRSSTSRTSTCSASPAGG